MSKKDVNFSLFSYETLVHAVSGSAGSVIAMLTFYPLDTVRSRLQLEENRESQNTLKALLELAQEEGFGTLYRGIVPVLESLWASNFVYFYTFHGLKLLSGEKRNQSAVKDLLLATVAGVVNVFTTTPLWVVNTRLKMKGVKNRQSNVINTNNNTNNYKGLLDGLVKIPREEGLKSLWRGTGPSLLLVTNPVIQFVIYEAVKRRLQEMYPGRDFGALAFFFVGAFSKAVATVMTYPLQIIQTKLRHGVDYPDLGSDPSAGELARYIVRKHGFQGLFKGMEAKILQTVLMAALSFATYEKIARFVFLIMKIKK